MAKRRRRRADGSSADELLRAAMEGVRPLAEDGRGRARQPISRLPSQPAPSRAASQSLEGAAGGVDGRVVRELRRGRPRFEAELDLHGMDVPSAATAVDDFLSASRRAGRRVVLVICGRGAHSVTEGGVLGPWLAGVLGSHRQVLAWTAAQPRDGGRGAFYVLLRR